MDCLLGEGKMSSAERPDLSAPPRDVRVRIAVAETQGWKWKRTEGTTGSIADTPRWVLSLEGGDRPYAMWDTGEAWAPNFPDYLTDPAAWGEMLEKERVHVQPASDSTVWYATTPADGLWHDGDTPGEAICAAVLAKYGFGTVAP